MSNMRELINIYERWENKPNIVQIEFPVVLDFEDYHDIGPFSDQLSRVTKTKVGSEEVGFSEGRYWGVFWIGKSPTQALIRQMLDAVGFDPDEDGHY